MLPAVWRYKNSFNENVSFTDYASVIQLPDGSKLAINQKIANDDMTSSSILIDFVLFLLSSLVTGPSFMSISSQGLELR